MTLELIESIANGDYVSANELFESRLEIIKEQKLFEEKRRIAALHEVMGGMTRAEAEKRIRERGMKPRKAADVLGDPRAPTTTQKSPKTSKAPSDAPGDIESQVKKLGQQWKSAKFGEKKAAVRMVRAAAKKYADSQDVEKKAPKNTFSSMSSYARRAALERRRDSKIDSLKDTNPLAAARMMKKSEIASAVLKKGKNVVIGGLSDIGSKLEPSYE